MTEEALDDMYEVILAYGGQAKVLQDMIELVEANPEYRYKLTVDAHKDLIAKYKTQAKTIKDYAQTFLDKKYNMQNKDYYNFFIGISNAMYDMLAQEGDTNIKPVLRVAPGEAEQIINVEQKQLTVVFNKPVYQWFCFTKKDIKFLFKSNIGQIRITDIKSERFFFNIQLLKLSDRNSPFCKFNTLE